MNPLVSCIMPTKNRRRWAIKSIEMFARQTYENRELIIVDDGDETLEDVAVGIPNVFYTVLARSLKIGTKRNVCVERSKGSLIAHWDDDDWQHPERLKKQVAVMLATGADVCGTNQARYYNVLTQTARRYVYPSATMPPFVLGNTFMYTRSYWQSRRFTDVQLGEDARFLYNPMGKIHVIEDDLIVGIIHDENAAPKHLNHPVWQILPTTEVTAVMGDDLSFYAPLRKA